MTHIVDDKSTDYYFRNFDRNEFSVTVREQPKMSALFMTKNSSTVSVDSGENSQSVASAIGAVSIEFWSERIVTFFVVKFKGKFLQKPKKTKQNKTKNIQKIYYLSFRSAWCK